MVEKLEARFLLVVKKRNFGIKKHSTLLSKTSYRGNSISERINEFGEWFRRVGSHVQRSRNCLRVERVNRIETRKSLSIDIKISAEGRTFETFRNASPSIPIVAATTTDLFLPPRTIALEILKESLRLVPGTLSGFLVDVFSRGGGLLCSFVASSVPFSRSPPSNRYHLCLSPFHPSSMRISPGSTFVRSRIAASRRDDSRPKRLVVAN